MVMLLFRHCDAVVTLLKNIQKNVCGQIWKKLGSWILRAICKSVNFEDRFGSLIAFVYYFLSEIVFNEYIFLVYIGATITLRLYDDFLLFEYVCDSCGSLY